MNIPRSIEQQLTEQLRRQHKVVIIYGARQVGKTTLAKEVIRKLGVKTLVINADERKYHDVFSSRDLNKMKGLIAGHDLLFIDEAQRISDIGMNIKILHDAIPELKILLSGSSSFDLANKLQEPLTGRTWTFTLYPIAMLELQNQLNPFELTDQLEERLTYGSYPEVFQIQNTREKAKYLTELTNSYLYKDVLELLTIKHSDKINDLLKLIAFQIGSEVSYDELSNTLDINKKTVLHYIDLLEKSFVIFRLRAYSRNLRKEISKKEKIYFYDLGIRNALIEQFQPILHRQDLGNLWENFLMVERKKWLAYHLIPASTYFWRIYTGAEIDYVEERDGILWGYEYKFKPKQLSAPATWKETYQGHFSVIHRENFLSFVAGSTT